ncbi:MAG: hypothetical protein IJZ78_06705 [Alistipes sp.]|nr:hypothetical protein [Alistipes sp.]
MRLRQLMATALVAIVALASWSCDKEPTETPVNKPTIGIMEPEFDAESMVVKVMIAPSTDATAWYWRVDGGFDTLDEAFTKVDGSAAQEVEFTASYGVEYTIKAYAENKAGKSDTAEKRFCAMPDGEVSISIGEITLNADDEVEVTIYPSKAVEAWYWVAYDTESTKGEYTKVEGNTETTLALPYQWNKRYELCVYAECDAIQSDEVAKEYYFELSVPTISVSKPQFDDTKMEVTFKVTPSEDTDHWFWGTKDGESTREEGAEPKSVSFKVEYDVAYTFEFVAANKADVANEPTVVEFTVISPVADIAIENLTAYTLDAVVTKKEHCVRYVAGAVHTSAFDRNLFIEQAQASLNPDPSYPFAVFNSATESRTFSEQDLVRNSRTDSDENAGIILLPDTSFTIAVYGEDADGNYNVVTKEVIIPKAEINGDLGITIAMNEITETSASATVTADAPCKVLFGLYDPTIADSDTDNPFVFEDATDDEIKSFFATTVQAVPTVYTEPITTTLNNRLEIDHKYYAYAIAINAGKIGQVAYNSFTTKRPTLTGTAQITAATIEAQTSHETLTVKVTPDANATKVRIYAAPTADHSAYADNLDYVMDADGYQNYREEYAIVDGVATAQIDIYHPGDNYYIYASALDSTGHAGPIVCVSRMAGYDTDYYTTIEEVVEEGTLSYYGTGTAVLTASEISEVDERVSVTLTATEFSSNVDKVWFMRLSSCMIDEIESRVKANLAEYAETGKVLGSVKSVTEGVAYKYVDDLSNSFNPKYEALLKYDNSFGGDIVVMVILDTAGKVNIHSYFAGGKGVVEM